MSPKLRADAIRASLNGLAEGNRVTKAERAARLRSEKVAASLARFAALYAVWKRSGQHSGGDWAALQERRLVHHIELRESLAAFARAKGLIEGD